MRQQETIPIGLMAVRDLIDKHPVERVAILAQEIRRRERERLVYHGTRKQFSFRIWATAKVAAIFGASSFVLAWTLGQIASLAQWVQSMQATSLKVPVPFRDDIAWNIGQYLPTSTAFEVAAKFPLFGWRDASLVAIVVMAVILVEALVVAILTWKHVVELKAGEHEAEEETRVLKEWLGDDRVARQ